MSCGCQRLTFRYTCGHKSRSITRCYTYDFKRNHPCLGCFMPECRPNRRSTRADNVCSLCVQHFAQYGRHAPQIIESFFRYKARKDLRGPIDPSTVTPQAYIPPPLLAQLAGAGLKIQPRGYRAKSPMRVAPPPLSARPVLWQPTGGIMPPPRLPPVPASSKLNQKKIRRVPTKFERQLKPPSPSESATAGLAVTDAQMGEEIDLTDLVLSDMEERHLHQGRNKKKKNKGKQPQPYQQAVTNNNPYATTDDPEGYEGWAQRASVHWDEESQMSEVMMYVGSQHHAVNYWAGSDTSLVKRISEQAKTTVIPDWEAVEEEQEEERQRGEQEEEVGGQISGVPKMAPAPKGKHRKKNKGGEEEQKDKEPVGWLSDGIHRPKPVHPPPTSSRPTDLSLVGEGGEPILLGLRGGGGDDDDEFFVPSPAMTPYSPFYSFSSPYPTPPPSPPPPPPSPQPKPYPSPPPSPPPPQPQPQQQQHHHHHLHATRPNLTIIPPPLHARGVLVAKTCTYYREHGLPTPEYVDHRRFPPQLTAASVLLLVQVRTPGPVFSPGVQARCFCQGHEEEDEEDLCPACEARERFARDSGSDWI
ncbi:hypothetical protein F4778DRAFT_272887 [Xylariomycetidae sp. FL2044]|nr:hypothetical protein F4778DRAFT_272887 [Xylariomycetidae sp. FL2044]